jgi:L-seryl-tRNA(Ser) seleniumtransferase
MLTALDVYFHKRDIAAEYRQWESWYAHINAEITRVPGVKTRVIPAAGASPFPVFEISWDSGRIGISAGELYKLLLDGEPRIMSHAAGDGSSFILRPVAMKPDDYKLVAGRLRAIFASAPKSKSAPAQVSMSANLTGHWDMDVEFVRATSHHSLMLQLRGGRLTGSHQGTSAHGDLEGTLSGDLVRFRSTLPVEGIRLVYRFEGTVSGDRMAGAVDLGEYGAATWKAWRHA